MPKTKSKLLWPRDEQLAEASGVLEVCGLVLMVFIESKLARILALVGAVAFGWISIEAFASLVGQIIK